VGVGVSRDKTATVSGKVVVVTGGARGIGLATATALHRLGARVAIGDVNETAAKAAGEQAGFEVAGKLDVTGRESFEAFLRDVEKRIGPVDVLINNAGIMPVGLVADESDEVTRRILDINVHGVILGTKLALERMLPRRSGHVINIASLAGETYAPGVATYCGSKYAVIGFTDAVRVENRGNGVDFSLVLPSFVNTELTAGTKGISGFRAAEPEEIAAAVVRLIGKPRAVVRVTWQTGALLGSQKFLPRRVSEAAARLLGGDHLFTDDVDPEQRRAYEERARGN